MTINNPKAYCDSLWDWSCLNGCFGNSGIMPTDVDGLVERLMHFLFLETKLPGVEVPTGQRILLNKLVATGYFTVMVIWGYPGNPEQLLIMGRSGNIFYEHADLKLLRERVSAWYEWANNSGFPPTE